MALWDPEAAGNAAVYLRLPNIQLIDIRNAPFDGKSAVWVPYSETGYCKVILNINIYQIINWYFRVKSSVRRMARSKSSDWLTVKSSFSSPKMSSPRTLPSTSSWKIWPTWHIYLKLPSSTTWTLDTLFSLFTPTPVRSRLSSLIAVYKNLL